MHFISYSMLDLILNQIRDKKIIILGFGREGASSYRFLRKHFPDMEIVAADRSEVLNTSEYQNDPKLKFVLGEKYADNLNDYDLIFKTPGINLNHINYFIQPHRITSQTELFLYGYNQQVIGVTGTKGKSTTSSLIYHILSHSRGNTFLAGNIGIPFFDIIDQLDEDSVIVAELSAHQLEYTTMSPHIALLLNMYQEHLDHFASLSNYQLAKMNITKYQDESDVLIYNSEDEHIPNLIKSHNYQRKMFKFSSMHAIDTGCYCLDDTVIRVDKGQVLGEYDLYRYDNLPGRHNYNNIMAAILAVKQFDISDEDILQYLASFRGLEHRIELVGTFNGIKFYNDSISTIPEAAIAAVKALRKVDTLIIGGFDRGISYDILIDYLHQNPIAHLVFTGPAGRRIQQEWEAKYPLPEDFIIEDDFTKIVDYCLHNTTEGKVCLLSPAASSYDQFKNFEERGRRFKSELQHFAENNVIEKNTEHE